MRILVVSRELTVLQPLWSLMELNSWELETVTTGWEALERVQSGLTPNLIVVDMSRGDTDCLHILRWLRRLRPELPLVLLCHPDDVSKRSDALRMGADEVLVKPCVGHDFEYAIREHLRGSRHSAEQSLGSHEAEHLGDEGSFVSTSPLMRKIVSQAELLAEVDVPVLILGEAGSGKEAVARLIHRLSVRSGFRFLKVNCPGMPGDLLEKEIFGLEVTEAAANPIPGKMEIAGKGTILIAEVTAMPSQLQTQLLNVLRHGHYTRIGSHCSIVSHARILMSSNANMAQAVAEKRIGEDFYHRASTFVVHVPPLRQRKEEIPAFLGYFMHKLAKHYGLKKREVPPSVLAKCQNYSWPGNLDQLESFVNRYLLSGDSTLALNSPCDIHTADVQARSSDSQPQYSDSPNSEPTDTTSLKSLVQNVRSEAEKTAIGLALQKTHWNRKAAARLLSVSYRTLLYKIERYQMIAPQAYNSPLLRNEMKGNGRVS
jgi:two-component system, NtrC family, response regulator AtoC